MISAIRGQVTRVGLDSVEIFVSGFGFEVKATPSTLSTLHIGQEASLAASLVVREDSLTLYGFADEDECAAFNILQSVTGIGPRTALASLAVHSPDSLRRAVAEADLAALQKIPGIGKKSAQRMVIEIGDRLGALTGRKEEPTQSVCFNPNEEEVVAALIQLGWSKAQAHTAVTKVGKDNEFTDVAQLLRASLQTLGATRG